MKLEVRSPDSFTLAAPLGFCFWDGLTARIIGDGLAVRAYLGGAVGARERELIAVPNRAGVYVLRGLPRFESRPKEALPRELRVEVRDEQCRFLPFAFTLSLPAQGLFDWIYGDGLPPAPPQEPPAPPANKSAQKPPKRPAFIPLFSSPTRTAPAATAVIRAQLFDPVAKRPAAWAVLEARPEGGPPALGIANEGGSIAVMMTYPKLPVIGERTALGERSWPLRLAARYSPAAVTGEPPDLRQVFGQTEAVLWADEDRTTHLGEQTLRFGVEIVVRSLRKQNQELAEKEYEELAEVLVTPA